MIDFFDEDFPLTKKQEEEEKQRLEAEAQKKTSVPAEAPVSSADDPQNKTDIANISNTEAIQPAQVFQEAIEEDMEQSDNSEEVAYDPAPDDTIENADSAPIVDSSDLDEAGSEDTLSPDDNGTDEISTPAPADSDSDVEDINDVAAENVFPDEVATESDTENFEDVPTGDTLPDEAVTESDIEDFEDVPTEDTLPDEAVTESDIEDFEDVLTEEALADEFVPESDVDDFESIPADDVITDGAVTESDIEHFEDIIVEDITHPESITDSNTTNVESTPTAEDKPRATLTTAEITSEIEDAVSSAINLHIETFIRGFKPSDDESDRFLRDELNRLNKKLDNVEKAVGVVEVPLADESDSQGFSYEYDERYFAEEETPAYKYPGLYKKTSGRSKDVDRSVNSRMTSGAANKSFKGSSRPQTVDKSSGNITVNTKTLLKMGAMVAATAAAVKLLSKKND